MSVSARWLRGLQWLLVATVASSIVHYADNLLFFEQYPEPLCELHPQLADRLGVTDGDLVTVSSRRSSMTLPAHVVATIRPDTVFIPYHWPGTQAANQLTNRALDPMPRMPEFKVAAVRVAKAEGRRPIADDRDLDVQGGSV